ncbi:YdcH family protein [Pseudahrensia aquimaris]|uniref:YdcH family protein n=1 Tax=Pseudahrensia aquimaris TaxID=744461 RepID=A0ABW3F9M2_9HYPH
MQDDHEQIELKMRLARLKIDHDDLHAAIDAMTAQGSDPLRIQRLKKKKLEIKDRIAQTASRILPDIIA